MAIGNSTETLFMQC